MEHDVVSGLLIRQDRVLLTQRPHNKPYAFHWELPGGKRELGETNMEALAREFQEETGLVVVANPAPFFVAEFPNPRRPGTFTVALHVVSTVHQNQRIMPLQIIGFGWFTLPLPSDLLIMPSLRACPDELVLAQRVHNLVRD